MRNTLLIVLGLLLIAGLAIAGGEGEPTADDGAKDTQEPVQLRFQTWHLGEEPWRSVLEEMKADFERENPDIEIVFDPVTYGDKEMVFTTQSEAGAAADIAHFSYRPIPQFIENGYLLDLTSFIEQEDAGYYDQFLEGPRSLAQEGGRIYALPDNFDPMVLIYNAEMFEEAGLDPNQPPQTRDEFLEYAETLTKDTDGDGRVDQWGFGLIGARQEGIFMRFSPWLWGAGGDYLNENNTASALDRPGSLDGFSFYVDLVTQYDVVPPGAIQTGAQEVRTMAANGQIAMFVGFAPTLSIIEAINPNIDARRTFRMAPLPVGGERATAAWISNRVISATTEHPEEAWRLYRYIHSKENQERWFTGAGVLSSRKDVRNSDLIMEDPLARVMAEEAQYARFEPRVVEWPQIADAVIDAIQAALSGSKSAEEALADAHAQVNELFSN